MEIARSLAEKIADHWHWLIGSLILAIIGAGLPAAISLWHGQSALSERIARLEEYRDTGPSSLETEVRLQDQRLKWAEANVTDLRASMRDITSELQSIGRQLEQIRRQGDDGSERVR